MAPGAPFARNRLAMLGLAIVVALVLVAIFADVLAPYSPLHGATCARAAAAAFGAHWFGTDDQGRDILSR
jgi:peptide/nickel transport system permease protein